MNDYKVKIQEIIDGTIKPLSKTDVRATWDCVYVKKFPTGEIYIGKTSDKLNVRFGKAKWQALNNSSLVNPHENTLYNYPNYCTDYEVYVVYKGLDCWEEEQNFIRENFYRKELLNVAIGI